jgi:hypothetical protein
VARGDRRGVILTVNHIKLVGIETAQAALAVPDRTIVTGNLADFPAKILNGARILTLVQALAALAR